MLSLILQQTNNKTSLAETNKQLIIKQKSIYIRIFYIYIELTIYCVNINAEIYS